MKYWQAILIKEAKWAWRTRQPKYLIGVIKALMHPEKYESWVNQSVCRVYREHTGNGKAFWESYVGLPKITDSL